MPGATVDHIVSIIIFLGAIVLFISLFSQTIQTAIVYQQHRATASKNSDLIDNMLLNPGSPNNWGQVSNQPTGFGLQDPEFTQYQLSPFSLMRISSANGEQVFYKQPSDTYVGTMGGFDNNLFIPSVEAVNYSSVLKLLGVNNTYGFQLTVSPIVSVFINETHAADPLKLSLTVTGTGFPLSSAIIKYCLIKVTLPATEAEYPSYNMQNGVITADVEGSAQIEFADVTDESQCYAFIAYAHLGGLLGVGHHERASLQAEYVVPVVKSVQDQKVLLAHNFDINASGPAGAELKYNATYALLTEDYALRELPLNASNDLSKMGILTSGIGNPDVELTLPSNIGILIVTYEKNEFEGGIALMPWGISSLAYPISFGGNPLSQEWVTTDLRQVTINRVSYQVKLALWSYSGQQVIN
jgi:hypothetical protein